MKKFIRRTLFVLTFPLLVIVVLVKLYKEKKEVDRAVELRKRLCFNTRVERNQWDRSLNERYRRVYGRDYFAPEHFH